MKALTNLVSFAMAFSVVGSADLPAFTPSANVTGTWEVTIHYPPPDGDYLATYVLKQDGEKLTGTYQGMYGPADVTGTIKSDSVVMKVTVKGTTAQFTGKVSSATKMSGMVTGTSDQPRRWTAARKK